MDFQEKAFQQATETAKLLLTLATGVVAFAATLIAVKADSATLLTPVSRGDQVLFVSAVVLLALSAATGIWTNLAISHVLSLGTTYEPTGIWDKRITVPFRAQIFSFGAGILLISLYIVLQTLAVPGAVAKAAAAERPAACCSQQNPTAPTPAPPSSAARK